MDTDLDGNLVRFLLATGVGFSVLEFDVDPARDRLSQSAAARNALVDDDEGIERFGRSSLPA